MIKDLDRSNKLNCSANTVHHCVKMLGLKSIIVKKRPKYVKGTCHKKFDNLLKRDFTATKPNQKWCTDFTYLKLTDDLKCYNCSIIATLNGKEITAELAIHTLEIAIEKNSNYKDLILHSDQGSQYTLKEFTDFCVKMNISQSMSKAGCPYDNVLMENFYGMLKAEYVSQQYFKNDDSLDQGIYEKIYCWYNHVRPHSMMANLQL